MKENSIEETKKQLELILKVRKEQKEIIECSGGSCMNCNPDIKALTESIEILSDYKRALKENEEWDRKFCNLQNLYFKLQDESESKQKEYQETYKDVREELKELKKENEELKLYNNSITSELEQMTTEKFKNGWFHQSEFKGLIPVQKVKDKISERQFELQQEYKDFEDDSILLVLQELLEGRK